MAIGLSSRALIGQFYQTLEEVIGAGWENMLGMTFQSDQDSEDYRWLGMVPAVREWVGARNVKQLATQGLVIVNKRFETTIAFTDEDLRRDKTGQTRVRINELADRMGQHFRGLLSTLITNGNGTNSGLCYDGQEFFDTDHSEGSSGTLVNDVSNSHVPSLSVVASGNPTQAEMAVAILDVIAYMFSYKDDQGEPMNEGATKFLLMTTVGLWGVAQAAVRGTALIGASGTVASSPLQGTGFQIDVVPNPRLSGDTVFYIFRTDGRTRPFIMQDEDGPNVQVLGEGSDHHFKNDEHLFGVKANRNAGYGQWQHAIRATLNTT